MFLLQGNLWWCWFDGVILDVYEPVALTFKTLFMVPFIGLDPAAYVLILIPIWR